MGLTVSATGGERSGEEAQSLEVFGFPNELRSTTSASSHASTDILAFGDPVSDGPIVRHAVVGRRRVRQPLSGFALPHSATIAWEAENGYGSGSFPEARSDGG
jgi:hypothetical protein